MVVKAINSYDEFKRIINGDKPVLIDFWATWCGPCRFISPVFEKLSGEAENQDIEFYKVDVDEQEQIAAEVGIRAMPTFMPFIKGQKGEPLVGADPSGLNVLIQKARGQ